VDRRLGDLGSATNAPVVGLIAKIDSSGYETAVQWRVWWTRSQGLHSHRRHRNRSRREFVSGRIYLPIGFPADDGRFYEPVRNCVSARQAVSGMARPCTDSSQSLRHPLRRTLHADLFNIAGRPAGAGRTLWIPSQHRRVGAGRGCQRRGDGHRHYRSLQFPVTPELSRPNTRAKPMTWIFSSRVSTPLAPRWCGQHCWPDHQPSPSTTLSSAELR